MRKIYLTAITVLLTSTPTFACDSDADFTAGIRCPIDTWQPDDNPDQGRAEDLDLDDGRTPVEPDINPEPSLDNGRDQDRD